MCLEDRLRRGAAGMSLSARCSGECRQVLEAEADETVPRVVGGGGVGAASRARRGSSSISRCCVALTSLSTLSSIVVAAAADYREDVRPWGRAAQRCNVGLGQPRVREVKGNSEGRTSRGQAHFAGKTSRAPRVAVREAIAHEEAHRLRPP